MAPFGKTCKIGFVLLAIWILFGLLTSEVSAAPKDWARPGVDPMKELGLVQ